MEPIDGVLSYVLDRDVSVPISISFSLFGVEEREAKKMCSFQKMGFCQGTGIVNEARA